MKKKEKRQKKNKLVAAISGVVLLSIALILVIKMYNGDVYQNSSVPRNSVTCAKGQYFSEGKCLLCPAGSYCEEDIRYFCPAGKGSLSESSTIMNCSSCAKGYYSSGDGEGCVACPSGMTTNSIGATSYDDCI